jgi:hypothetical protein
LKVTFQHKGFEETRRLGLRNETEQVCSYIVRGFPIEHDQNYVMESFLILYIIWT